MGETSVKIIGMKARKRYACVACLKEIKGFRNKASAEEYGISGFCQNCQDRVFGKDKKKLETSA